MGANNVLPAVPTFAAGSPSIASLSALSYAASFLIDHDVRPTWKFISTATQSLTSGAWTAVQFNHVVYDCDSTYSGINFGANIITQGYYEMEACVQLEAGATKDNFALCFAWSPTGGSPYFGSGPMNFGYKGCATPTTAAASADACYSISAICPFPAYPGDLFQVLAFSSANHTLDYNQNTSFNQGRFSTQFTGRWVRSGS